MAFRFNNASTGSIATFAEAQLHRERYAIAA